MKQWSWLDEDDSAGTALGAWAWIGAGIAVWGIILGLVYLFARIR